MVLRTLSREVRHEIVYVHAIQLESLARAQVEIADDLVDVHFAGHVAPFAVLGFDLFGPAFGYALRGGRASEEIEQGEANRKEGVRIPE